MDEIENILNTIIDDIVEAAALGMTVDEMYAMYDEINNHDFNNSNDDYEEWPYCLNNMYTDEGNEESMY